MTKKIGRCLTILSVLVTCAGWIPAQASVVAVDGDVPYEMDAGGTSTDPAQYIIGSTGAYTTNMSTAYVGSTTSNNQLAIQNGSSLSVGAAGYIGFQETSDNNSITISGNGSELEMLGSLTVGFSGSHNSLVIEDGGKVFRSGGGGSGSIGYNVGSSHNSVVIRGAGSSWGSIFSLTVGMNGSDNFMRVEDGGTVSTGYLTVGNGNGSTSNIGNNNSLVITGSGSEVTANYYSTVGGSSSGNSMTIENGAALTTYGLRVGVGTSSAAANNNVLKVAGAGSSLTITDERIGVGGVGTGNSLKIEDGAVVVADNTSTPNTVGDGTATSGNSMLVSGADSSFTGTLFIGRQSSSNALTIENGATVTSEFAIVGYSSTGNANSASVKGVDSGWNIAGQLEVGQTGGSNSLIIESGASITTGSALIGYGSGGNNFVEVRGEDSVWRNEGKFTLGSFSSNNTLTISDSAIVIVDGDFVVSEYTSFLNFLRLDGGFFAWEGDRASDMLSLLNNNVIQFWDGTAWASAVGGQATYTFFATDEEGFAATGYEGLGGYTVMTSVPEPGTWALLGGTALVASVVYRRRTVLRR